MTSFKKLLFKDSYRHQQNVIDNPRVVSELEVFESYINNLGLVAKYWGNFTAIDIMLY